MYFDSHAHIDDERFDADRDETIKRALDGGLAGFLNAGADMESSARGLAIAEKYPGVFAAVGIHPHDAKAATEADYAKLAQWALNPKVLAIGEIGLDYHYNLSPKEVQQEVFIRQLDVARQTGLPFIIHDREAHGDCMTLIKREAKGLPGVFHCFSGSWEMAQELLALGLYISFAGPLTFANSVKLKQIAAVAPLERVLIETDSPYLTPPPHRGRRNEPLYVKLVAAELAALRGMEPDEVGAITYENAKRLFRLE
ncbi:MAG: hydrolase, TatD family [Anaerosporomusa subterranea]|jgi:TatD DNase family protein|nr:hydrolase, TatD family [Anaerosporomusa subterranea]